MGMIKTNKASITVETAIVFPIVISMVLLLINIIYITEQYEMINYVLSDTCSQMADYAYVYHEGCIVNLSNAVKDKSDKGVDGLVSDVFDKLPISDDGNFKSIISDSIKGYINDYIDQADDQLYIPIARLLFTRNLSEFPGEAFDSKENEVNFSKSLFFNENNNIYLNMTYKQKVMIPFLSINSIDVEQSITMNSWLKGVWPKINEETENIWLLDNFERGRKLQRIFNANLPANFPVISSYINNKVIMIKSLDFTTKTYLSGGNLYSRVAKFVDTLNSYGGQATPWGPDQIVIKSSDILHREIILVIPEDEQEEVIRNELLEAQNYAKMKGVLLTIEKYGKKHIEDVE